jgi:hypothetical protein
MRGSLFLKREATVVTVAVAALAVAALIIFVTSNPQSGRRAANPVTGISYASGSDGLQRVGLFKMDPVDKAARTAAVVGEADASGIDSIHPSFLQLSTVDVAGGAATDIGSHEVTLERQRGDSGLAFRDDGTFLSLASVPGVTGGFIQSIPQMVPRLGVATPGRNSGGMADPLSYPQHPSPNPKSTQCSSADFPCSGLSRAVKRN